MNLKVEEMITRVVEGEDPREVIGEATVGDWKKLGSKIWPKISTMLKKYGIGFYGRPSRAVIGDGVEVELSKPTGGEDRSVGKFGLHPTGVTAEFSNLDKWGSHPVDDKDKIDASSLEKDTKILLKAIMKLYGGTPEFMKSSTSSKLGFAATNDVWARFKNNVYFYDPSSYEKTSF